MDCVDLKTSFAKFRGLSFHAQCTKAVVSKSAPQN